MSDMIHNNPDVSIMRQAMTDNYREISTARQALRDGYQNLHNVADYCEKNYMEASDKYKALENTMALVTQTLASVACQVGAAAQHVSDMLEKQSQKLQQEEERVRLISQLLDIHVEKVSRKKIGRLTIVKKFQHTEKMLQKGSKGPLASYTRVPLNFTSLDDTGHGTKDSDSQLSKTGTMSRKISGKSMSQSTSSLRRSCRVKDPVIPPLIPEQKFPYPLILDGFSPSLPDLPNINEDFAQLSPPALHSQFPICKSPQNIDDSPPPPPVPDYKMMNRLKLTENGSPFPMRTYTQYIGDSLPPPPAPDYEWATENGSQFSVCTYAQNIDDSLPPPPVPDYEVTDTFWPIENGYITGTCQL
ncbi:ABI gene family member 3 isoform X2 [Mixophyes fleayi]|uniref:ABI gene family member 3 isoform X2 n=1 Tax=Mixophyes fleayi TaxID=3061075 RepID=UPI003F4D96B9